MQNQPPLTGASPNPSSPPTPTPAGANPALDPALATNVAMQPSSTTLTNPVQVPASNGPTLPPVTPSPYTLSGTPSVVEPVATPGFGPAAPGQVPTKTTNTVASAPDPFAKPRHSIIETIILIIVSLIAVTFVGLFIWKYLEWDNVKTDVDGQIDVAVAMAIAENTTKLENEFSEREKYPYKTFSGPTDYGSLSFEYPKTWNVYIAKDAANGGDFEAYFNPGEVQPIGNDTINSLRVTIRDAAFDSVVKSYDSNLRNGKLSVVTRNVGSAVANVYTGEIRSNVRGIVAIFKLRDKTVLLQTDAELFSAEFYKILDTVTFVE